jgi:hypothetical protein
MLLQKLLIRSRRAGRAPVDVAISLAEAWTVAASKGNSCWLRGCGHRNKPRSREWKGGVLAAAGSAHAAAGSILPLVLSCCVQFGAPPAGAEAGGEELEATAAAVQRAPRRNL